MDRKTRYQWSEDGVVEYCNREDLVAERDIECYHCLGLIRTGDECVKLTSSDGDIYILHPDCAKKGCF